MADHKEPDFSLLGSSSSAQTGAGDVSAPSININPYESPTAPLQKMQRGARKFDGRFFRAVGCLVLGIAISAHCTWILMFGGGTLMLLFGLGPGLVLGGLIDLYYWYDD